MVVEHAHEYPSQWATMRSVAEKLGCTVEALRRWVRQSERDAGKRAGLTSDETRAAEAART
jgi:transposase